MYSTRCLFTLCLQSIPVSCYIPMTLASLAKHSRYTSKTHNFVSEMCVTYVHSVNKKCIHVRICACVCVCWRNSPFYTGVKPWHSQSRNINRKLIVLRPERYRCYLPKPLGGVVDVIRERDQWRLDSIQQWVSVSCWVWIRRVKLSHPSIWPTNSAFIFLFCPLEYAPILLYTLSIKLCPLSRI